VQFEVVTCAERETTVRARPGTRWIDDERPSWRIRAAADSAVFISRITYGQVPVGFRTLSSADALAQGSCYFARFRARAGGGEAVVVINPDGSLRQLTKDQTAALYDSWRQGPS
jgi:hypothetical protein